MQKLSHILPVFRMYRTVLMPNVSMPVMLYCDNFGPAADELIEGNVVAALQTIPSDNDDNNKIENNEPFYKTGCAGYIAMADKDDCTISMIFVGMCRFDVIDIVHSIDGIERVKVDYSRYVSDMSASSVDDLVIKDEQQKINQHIISNSNKMIMKHMIERIYDPANLNNESYVSMLTMLYPWKPEEKQTLLETVDAGTRSEMAKSLIQMEV